jgi:nucleotide-binding universal stress UspA family protein
MKGTDANTIVVGVDGSKCGEEALRCAIAEAEVSRRALLIVHAWSWISDAMITPFAEPEGKKLGSAILRRAQAEARGHGVAAQIRLFEGPAAKGLVEAAQGAAMLVVGSHGYRGFAKALLGSVSHACLEHASCPVLVVPPPLATDHRPPEGDQAERSGVAS